MLPPHVQNRSQTCRQAREPVRIINVQVAEFPLLAFKLSWWKLQLYVLSMNKQTFNVEMAADREDAEWPPIRSFLKSGQNWRDQPQCE